MPGRTSTALASWSGDLEGGSGIVSSASGALAATAVTWQGRTRRSDLSSPEELLAAAHASCYSMALSGALTARGSSPHRLEVRASCHFEPVEGEWTIAGLHLDVDATVPDLDEQQLQDAAEEARLSCPMSRALRDNVNVTVEVRQAAAVL